MSGSGVGRVGIVVGSRSDIAAAEKAAAVLDELGVASETRVISAHRAPDLLAQFVGSAEERGIGVFIAIAGLAAALAVEDRAIEADPAIQGGRDHGLTAPCVGVFAKQLLGHPEASKYRRRAARGMP